MAENKENEIRSGQGLTPKFGVREVADYGKIKRYLVMSDIKKEEREHGEYILTYDSFDKSGTLSEVYEYYDAADNPIGFFHNYDVELELLNFEHEENISEAVNFLRTEGALKDYIDRHKEWIDGFIDETRKDGQKTGIDDEKEIIKGVNRLKNFTRTYTPEFAEEIDQWSEQVRPAEQTAAPEPQTAGRTQPELKTGSLVSGIKAVLNILKSEGRITLSDADRRAIAGQQQPAAKNKDENQFVTLLKDAIGKDRVPWQKDLKPGTMAPHNPMTGKPFTGNALLHASLHQNFLKTNDPRYMSEAQINETNKQLPEDELLSPKKHAVPLKIRFNEKRGDGTWDTRTVTYYNASQISGIAPFEKPANEIDPNNIVPQEKAGSVTEQCVKDMAGYMKALLSQKGFEPAPVNRDNAVLKKMAPGEIMKLASEAKNETWKSMRPAESQKQEVKLEQKMEQKRGMSM